jgi:hypothetical protein
MKPIVINITDKFNDYKNKIDIFLRKLDIEKEYFPTIDKSIKNSKIIIIAVNNDNAEVIGVAGVEKTRYFYRSYILMLKDYQGMGIGKSMYMELFNALKRNKRKIVLAIVNRGNMKSLKMHIKLGYKLVGIRWNFYYLYKPLSIHGIILFYLIKAIFPFVVIADSLYENIYLPKKTIKTL